MLSVGEKWLTVYIHIDKHLDHCKARGFSEETTVPARRMWLERLTREHGDLHEITAQQVAAFLAHPGWAPQTRATAWGHIHGYLHWAVRTGRISANPMDQLDRPKVPYQDPRGTNPASFRLILREAVEPHLTAAILAGYAGLRCFEIARTERADIDREWIRVRGKGGRVDEIPTHPQIWQHIRGRREGPLVRDTHGHAYRPNTLSRLFAVHARRKLMLPDLTLHRLRHLYGNSLRQNGVDLEVIRTLLRHRSLATTQRYLCARDEERRNAILALPVVA
jgi:integrase/recombinase XerD